MTGLAIIGLAGLVFIGGCVAYRLLEKITHLGGSRRNALDVTARFMAEADAFRGSASLHQQPWDGKNRIAPPTQEGG